MFSRAGGGASHIEGYIRLSSFVLSPHFALFVSSMPGSRVAHLPSKHNARRINNTVPDDFVRPDWQLPKTGRVRIDIHLVE